MKGQCWNAGNVNKGLCKEKYGGCYDKGEKRIDPAEGWTENHVGILLCHNSIQI